MFFRKKLAVLLIFITAGVCLPAVAQQGGSEDHSAHHPEGGSSQRVPQPKRGSQQTNGGMAGMDGCPMHEEMMGSKSAEERHAMMEQRIRLMTPEMRKKQLAMMEKHIQMMQDHMQMMRDHLNDPPQGATGNHKHEQ